MYGGKVSMKLLDFFAFLPNKSDGTKFVMMSPAGCGYGGEYLADMDTCWIQILGSRVINIACKGCNLEIICDAGSNNPNCRVKFM